VLSELAQKRLDLACEVKALVRGDDVVRAALEIVVESASQLGQDRLELGNQVCAAAGANPSPTLRASLEDGLLP
jgi:hypothetical protein